MAVTVTVGGGDPAATEVDGIAEVVGTPRVACGGRLHEGVKVGVDALCPCAVLSHALFKRRCITGCKDKVSDSWLLVDFLSCRVPS